MMLADRASNHTLECDWHFDQYPCDCTCGASRRAEIDATAPEHLQTVILNGRTKMAPRRADVLIALLCVVGLTSFVWSFT